MRQRRTGAVLGLVGLTLLLTGCGDAGASTPTSSGAPTIQAPATPNTGVAAAPAAATGGAAGATRALSGTWRYSITGQVETLRLRQDKKGKLSGDGDATVVGNKGAKGGFSIQVHDGSVSGKKVSLTLYSTQLFGQGLTAVQNLRCTSADPVLHCLMSIPLFSNEKNIPQEFQRQ